MSSSGEEVELEAFDGEHEKAFHWSNEHVRKLVRFVQSTLTPETDLAPYNSVDINWDGVEEAMGVEPAKCKHKWDLLLKSVRTYRTMSEILMEILCQNSRTDISKYNKSQHTEVRNNVQMSVNRSVSSAKKKKKKNPDHPPRPKVNGYSVFCSKKMGTMLETGLAGVPLMLKLAAMWKELSDSERAVYSAECLKAKEEYLSKVKDYAEKHPDDTEIQTILAEELAKSKGAHARLSKKKRKEEITDLSQETLDDTVSSADSILLSPKRTPKKRRNADDNELSQDSSMSKKKKKARVWTGEDVYVEVKFDSCKEDHPDLDDDEVFAKLARKFSKMSEERKAKYKRKAEERSS